jgi:hypothetical protein
LSAAATVPQPANAAGAFGLYPAQDFRLATGECRDCPTIRQALWYFRDQTIAVPLAGHPVSGFATGVHAEDDVRAWAASRPPEHQSTIHRWYGWLRLTSCAARGSRTTQPNS